MALESSVAKMLLDERVTLDKERSIVAGQRPKLEAYLIKLEGKVQTIVNTIKSKEAVSSNSLRQNSEGLDRAGFNGP